MTLFFCGVSFSSLWRQLLSSRAVLLFSFCLAFVCLVLVKLVNGRIRRRPASRLFARVYETVYTVVKSSGMIMVRLTVPGIARKKGDVRWVAGAERANVEGRRKVKRWFPTKNTLKAASGFSNLWTSIRRLTSHGLPIIC